MAEMAEIRVEGTRYSGRPQSRNVYNTTADSGRDANEGRRNEIRDSKREIAQGYKVCTPTATDRSTIRYTRQLALDTDRLRQSRREERRENAQLIRSYRQYDGGEGTMETAWLLRDFYYITACGDHNGREMR